jgi:excinuclease UvrABC nuclease subunit
MSKVREATVEEIAALPGFSDALAADIHARLRQDDAPEVK